jgi:hypothetical protein
MATVGRIAAAVLMSVALIAISVSESWVAVRSRSIASPTWLCAIGTSAYISAFGRRWWTGPLVAELPPVELVGFFECGEVAGSGW